MKSRLIQEKKLFGKDISLPSAYGSTVLLCLGVSVGTIVLQIGVLIGIFAVARKPPPVLVQTQSGDSLVVKDIPASSRDSKAISKFTGEVLTMMLSWSGYLPAETIEESTKPRLDRGITVEGENSKYVLPTSSWEASFAFEPEFRAEFLPKLAQFVPKAIFNGQAQTFYVPQFVGEPVSVGQGKWKLDVIGSIHVIGQNHQLKDSIPFNRTVYVRAITPMFKRGLPEASSHNQLAHKVLQIRSAALEIYAITDLEQKEIGQ